MHAIQDVTLHANLLETILSPPLESSICGGQFSSGGRGREFQTHIQCQICRRFGHLAQRCFFRFNREYDGSSPNARASNLADRRGHGALVPSSVFGQHHGSSSMAPLDSLLGGNVWPSAAPLVNQNNRVSNPHFQSPAGQFACGPQFGLGHTMYHAPRCASGGAYMLIRPGHFDRPANHRSIGLEFINGNFPSGPN